MSEFDPARAIATLDTHLRGGFDALDARLREQAELLARIDERQLSQQTALERHDTRLGVLEVRVGAVEQRVAENARTSNAVGRLSWLFGAAVVSAVGTWLVNRWFTP